MEAIVFYLLMQWKKQFEAEDSEIYPLCLGNILKNFTFNNMKKKKTGLKGSVILLLITMILILAIF